MTKETAQQIIDLAARHAKIATGRPGSQDFACAKHSFRTGDYEYAARQARASLRESVGHDHPDYRAAAALTEGI